MIPVTDPAKAVQDTEPAGLIRRVFCCAGGEALAGSMAGVTAQAR